MMLALGFSPPGAAPAFTVHHTTRMKAATPISAFCANLTMTPIFIAESLTSAPAATTVALVSSVPPSHAPPTISGMPKFLMIQGWMIIIGTAQISTSEATYDSFFLSPAIAPQVAIAADTPQMATDEDSIAAKSSSTLSFLASQKQKYHTTNTTMTACRMPRAPYCRTSSSSNDVPRMTSPVLI